MTFVRIRQKTTNAADVTVSAEYAESLGDAVEVLDVPATNHRGVPLPPSAKSATPKKSASA